MNLPSVLILSHFFPSLHYFSLSLSLPLSLPFSLSLCSILCPLYQTSGHLCPSQTGCWPSRITWRPCSILDTCACTHIRTHACTHTHHAHTFTNTFTHAHTHIYTHSHTHTLLSSWWGKLSGEVNTCVTLTVGEATADSERVMVRGYCSLAWEKGHSCQRQFIKKNACLVCLPEVIDRKDTDRQIDWRMHKLKHRRTGQTHISH